jgi:hypothetical protein
MAGPRLPPTQSETGVLRMDALRPRRIRLLASAKTGHRVVPKLQGESPEKEG